MYDALNVFLWIILVIVRNRKRSSYSTRPRIELTFYNLYSRCEVGKLFVK